MRYQPPELNMRTTYSGAFHVGGRYETNMQYQPELRRWRKGQKLITKLDKNWV